MTQRLLLGLFSLALLLAPLSALAAPPAKQPAEGETEIQPTEGDATAEEPAPTADASESEAADSETTEAAPEETTPPAETEPADDPVARALAAQEAQAKFDEVFERWRALLLEIGTVREEYAFAAEEELPAKKARFEELLDQGYVLLEELRAAGIEAYRTAPNENRQVSNFLFQLLSDDMLHSRYEQAAPLAQLLIDNQYDNKDIYSMAGVSYFVLHDYDKAQQYLEQADQLGELSGEGAQYLAFIDEARELWAEEAALREAEAENDDLPRVLIKTTEGDIVVELFEDQADTTVGNFVHLVENGTYEGTPFHRVLPDFMAQGGDPNGDGSGGPGYNIYDEFDEPGARNHFRGSLSMANTGQPNTGGSQFFLCFSPQYDLNGRHTVFGRVIEGMEVLGRIQRIDPDNPDDASLEPSSIISTEVLRKRDHEYVPRPVE